MDSNEERDFANKGHLPVTDREDYEKIEILLKTLHHAGKQLRADIKQMTQGPSSAATNEVQVLMTTVQDRRLK